MTMTLTHAAAVAAGGFFGANARYFATRWFHNRFQNDFPYGTLSINLIGSFALGWIVGHGWNESLRLLFGTGFLGAFTTFSTLKADCLRLYRSRKLGRLALYLVLTYGAGLGLAAAAYYMH
ncbi:fluoride efflux transporter CrcB [Paenibacillus sp. HJGM_3]|uniref:fluoride efflux transporter CrcB n=1 Tax=Paenibacillus sp. HJGM_3 TaxID=3379816 RepID=UPI00385E97EE